MLLLHLLVTALLGIASASTLPVAAAAAAEPVEARDSAPSYRILSLGASITNGLHSSHGNGYRSTLRNLLAPAHVEFIGKKCSGNMTNGNNEGHPGFVISQMQPLVDADLPYKPNVVLIYVGTNDMLYPVDPSNAPARMASLVSDIATKSPGTLIVVGNLFLDTNPAVEARIDTFNQALPGALAPLQANGTNVVIANLASVLTAGDLYKDGEHPVNSGYYKMAQVFAGAINQAQNSNKVPAMVQNVALKLKLCNGAASASSGTAVSQTATSTGATSSATGSLTSTSSEGASPISSTSPSTSTSTQSSSGVRAAASTIPLASIIAIVTTLFTIL